MMTGIADCVIWTDKSLVWGVVDWQKLLALPESANLQRIEAKSMNSVNGIITHPLWGENSIEGRWWQNALMLGKTLNVDNRAPAEYWSDERGYLFLKIVDGRGVELAIAVAPLELGVRP